MSAFPWPVLTDDPATSDYPGLIINSKELTAETLPEGMRILWNPSTSAAFVNQMLDEGGAVWIVEFCCPKTMFMRRQRVANKDSLKELLSFNEVRGEVSVNIYIQCTDNIEDFRPQGISPELESFGFSLKPGDIIGTGQVRVFADPEFIMAPGMRSIFKIRPAGPADGSATYQCNDDGDYFTIVLERSIYNQFESARRSANVAGKKAASALIVLPPLVLTIKTLCELDPKVADLSNAQRRLLTLLESCGVPSLTSATPPIEAAMLLLEKSNVLTTCFERISLT